MDNGRGNETRAVRILSARPPLLNDDSQAKTLSPPGQRALAAIVGAAVADAAAVPCHWQRAGAAYV